MNIRIGCYNRPIILAKPGKDYEKITKITIKPKCRDCMYSLQRQNGISICTLFKETNDFLSTKDARNDNNLCGPDAYYFKHQIKKLN